MSFDQMSLNERRRHLLLIVDAKVSFFGNVKNVSRFFSAKGFLSSDDSGSLSGRLVAENRKRRSPIRKKTRLWPLAKTMVAFVALGTEIVTHHWYSCSNNGLGRSGVRDPAILSRNHTSKINVNGGGGRGCIAQRLQSCFSPCGPGFDYLDFDVAEIYRRHWLEENGQRLGNVDRIHLVLASGKPVLQKDQSNKGSWQR